MAPPLIKLSPSDARKFLLRAMGLVAPHVNVAAALAHHGFVQIDPINICGRMHEHIMRTRVEGYVHGGMHQYLHGLADDAPLAARVKSAKHRDAFEHFHPGRTVLSAFPVEAWPFLSTSMDKRGRTPGRWLGKLTPTENRLAKRILSEIEQRGALSSTQIEDHADHVTHQNNGWGNSRLVKVVMDKLFGHGRLLIARRQLGRRVFDLPERLLPAKVLACGKPSVEEITRWIARLKLRQHRLTPLKRTELPHVRDEVLQVEVLGCAPLYCLRSDEWLLDSKSVLPHAPLNPRLIAPLDPLILDRTLLKNLWNFDYTWEVYTPEAKRKRGYYALPLLAGDRLVGHVDLKADRARSKLLVVSRRCARGYRSAPAVAEVARFLGLR